MSNQSPVHIILANRPRLFRELLQHALNSPTEKNPEKHARPFEIIAVSDSVPNAAQLQDADWLIVDEETAPAAVRVASSIPHLKILSVEGRGHRLQLLTGSSPVQWQVLSSTPSLDELANVLREGAPHLQQQAQA